MVRGRRVSVNVAVVGLGKMGLSHLAIANALPGLNVVAICDASTLVGRVMEKYTGIRFFDDFDELLTLPGLNAVLIATPTTTHETMARKAIERGLHVFCEKPLTLSAAESSDLARTASAKGLLTQVGYHNRFIGTFREVKRLLDAGALGKISHSLGEAYGPVVLKPAKPTWRGKAGNGGGCLYDYAAHPLNLLNWYFGEAGACSGAILKSGFSAEVDDEVYAGLSFEEGVTAQLSVNWSDPSVRKMTTRISIWGTGGRIFADRQEIQVFLTGSAEIPEGYRQGWTVKYITELTPPVQYYLRGEEYSAQLEAFAAAAAGGTSVHENGFASSSKTDAAIELIRAAAENGGSVGRFGADAAPRKQAGFVGRMLGR